MHLLHISQEEIGLLLDMERMLLAEYEAYYLYGIFLHKRLIHTQYVDK